MRVLSNDTITREDISKVLNGEAVALRIPDYYPESTCDKLADALTSSRLMGTYSNAPKIGRVGMAYFEAIESTAAQLQYHENAVGWNLMKFGALGRSIQRPLMRVVVFPSQPIFAQ